MSFTRRAVSSGSTGFAIGASIVLNQVEDTTCKTTLKLLELNLIANFPFNALQIALQLRKIR